MIEEYLNKSDIEVKRKLAGYALDQLAYYLGIFKDYYYNKKCFNYTINNKFEVIFDGIGFYSEREWFGTYYTRLFAKYYVKRWYRKNPVLITKEINSQDDLRKIIKNKVQDYA